MKLRLDLENFDACPQYNDWLDAQYEAKSGFLDIFGFHPRPSFVLHSLSRDTYQAAFADFQQQREEEIKQTVFDEFPSPIAHYFYRFENGYESELQRLHLLRDTWEATVDILHAAILAECRFRQIPLTDPVSFSQLFSDSVAQRLLNIERIADHANKQGIALGISQIVKIATLEAMREFNQTRNGFSHSAAQSEVQARTWISQCYEDVIGILDDLQGLADVNVFRYIGQVENSIIRCEVFRGHSFTKTLRNIALTKDQVRDSQRYFQQGQILISCGGCVFGLRPLLYYPEDTTGNTTKLCMFRKTRGDPSNRRVEYEVAGEAARWEEDRAVFNNEIDELRQLFGLLPDRDALDAQ
jgi:hypothetical protein